MCEYMSFLAGVFVGALLVIIIQLNDFAKGVR
jgi:hypothetical protein